MKLHSLLIISFILFLFSCKKDVPEVIEEPSPKTENVIIIVMDGPRYIDTWGDPTHQNIPKLTNYIQPKGVVNNNFYNNGFTWTLPGHLAMVSGQYYFLTNNGSELPPSPTIFQYFNEAYPNKNSWIVSTKDKLEVLTNTADATYNNQYLANVDCGVNGLGTGYRKDSVTFYNAKNVLENNPPNLMLINFKEPDNKGHANDYLGYLAQIPVVDNYIYELFKIIETSPFYKDKTAVFITNDHGRHDDDNGGFQNHGDSCEGCRHIMFFAYGPEFKSNKEINTRYELIDIAATTAKLLGVELPGSEGVVMTDLFK